MAVTKVTVFFYYTKEERDMKSEIAETIGEAIKHKIAQYCPDCKFWEGTCTKKVAIRVCQKEKIKVKSED